MSGAANSPQKWVLDLRRPDAARASAGVLSGVEPLEWAGFSLGAGDINADGISDLVIGAPGGTDDRPSRRGRLYVVYGGVEPLPSALDLAPRRGAAPSSAARPSAGGAAGAPPRGADVIIDGAGDFDHFGRALAVADLDSDGAADIVAGAPRADGPAGSRADCGEVFIVFGGTGLPPRIELSRTPPGVRVSRIVGRSAGGSLGSALVVGDIAGDPLPEIAAGAPLADGRAGALGASDSGEAIVIPGRASWPALIDLERGEPGAFVLRGLDAGDQAGSALAVGDFDGDGTWDLAVGARGADGPGNQRPDAGEVLLVFGERPGRNAPVAAAPAPPAAPEIAPPGAPALIVPGAGIGDTAGSSLAMGDVDGDRFADLIIGAPLGDGPARGRLDAGGVIVVHGRPRRELEAIGGAPARPDLPGRPMNGAAAGPGGPLLVDPAAAAPGIAFVHGADPGDHAGVRGAVDLGADGRADLLIGAEDSASRRNGRAGGGELAILPGSRLAAPVDLRASGAALIFGPTGGAHLGAAATATDMDGDGRPELIVSAPQAGQSLSGRVYVLRGSWSGLGAAAPAR